MFLPWSDRKGRVSVEARPKTECQRASSRTDEWVRRGGGERNVVVAGVVQELRELSL